ncbi:MAG TPA: MobC family plasmid mobilization relaxosome protein [Clostridia bacterium]|nr:MobC family plasmid mobilization relaxosome protein [Clostridia bacterium]
MAQREAFLSVRMSAAERQKLDALCRASNLSVSALVRKLLNGTKIQENRAKDFKALYTEINRIGNNINQIARSVNAGIATPEDAAQALFLLKKIYTLMEKAADPAWQ